MPLPFQAAKRKIPGGLGDSVPQFCYAQRMKKLKSGNWPIAVLAPLIRHVLAAFRAEELKAQTAAEPPGSFASSFLQALRRLPGAPVLTISKPLGRPAFLAAITRRPGRPRWTRSCTSGSSSKPPASYSFAASEVFRKCHFKVDRAQVRRWAMENNLAHPKPNHRPTAPVKRWQRSRIGELWQLDATPHPWFPDCPQPLSHAQHAR